MGEKFIDKYPSTGALHVYVCASSTIFWCGYSFIWGDGEPLIGWPNNNTHDGSLFYIRLFFRRNDESSRLVAYIQRSHPKVKGAHGPSSSSRVPQLCPCTTAIVPMEKNNNSTEGEKKKRPSSNSCSYECTCRLLKIFSFLLLWDYSLRFFL